MCGKQFWENICRAKNATLYGSRRAYCQKSPKRPSRLQQRMLRYGTTPCGENFRFFARHNKKTTTSEQKPLSEHRFGLAFKNGDQLHIMNQYALQKRVLIFQAGHI